LSKAPKSTAITPFLNTLSELFNVCKIFIASSLDVELFLAKLQKFVDLSHLAVPFEVTR